MTTPLPKIATLYEQNYPLWLETMTKYLRERRFEQLDLDNLIEELEAMGGSRKDALENNLIVILAHLLKWKYQPSKRSGSWRGSIREHRRRVSKALVKHPGLKPYFETIFSECYTPAKEWTADETGLPLEAFPLSCPFTPDEALNPDYLPD
jgi:hypothetical protein